MSGEPVSAELASAVADGDRRALARAITLAESDRLEDRERARELLEETLPLAGGAVRVGVTGAPGVGKSTLIEALGVRLVEAGHRVAVLAVDPTSTLSGGSVLGDKTRMSELARLERAFIRPSPSGQAAGGVARRTRDAVILVEAWGADVVLVETVGVGQSETAVARVVDVALLLVGPGAGDDLQGIKRGLVELVDVIAVTKADGALRDLAERTRGDYAAAAGLLGHGEAVPVLTCSALAGEGLDEVWQAVRDRHVELRESGELERHRAEQAREWMWAEVREGLVEAALAAAPVALRAAELEGEVAAGRALPEAAAQEVVRAMLDDGDDGVDRPV